MGDINARKTLLLGSSVSERFAPTTQLFIDTAERAAVPKQLRRRRRSLAKLITPYRINNQADQ